MTRPRIYLLRMAVFLGFVAVAAALLFPRLQEAFLANAVLNGMILGVLLLGIGYSIRQVLLLQPEVSYLEQLKRESSGGLIFPGSVQGVTPPRLLGPMANMLRERKGRLTLSALSTRTLLDSIQIRIGESHDISRYLIGLLIFLGLLGTFWGLLETIDSVAETIGSLSAGGDAAVLFDQLKDGLERPLSGMGTAFSSSLFGLAGSLVLGFLELQAGQAHNRFVNELEEWLSGLTRLSSGGEGVAGGEASVPAYLTALLESTADSLDSLQRTIARGEDDRQEANRNLALLTERLSVMTEQMRTEQEVMRRLAETHSAIKPLLQQLSEAQFGERSDARTVLDEATRDHIRTLALNVTRIAGEVERGREQTVGDIRAEIRLLARTIAALAEETEG
ncbi:flagellar motor protein MotA [Algihabitans albus]|uniref:flagellar motor protein MotA n=1 Tax=Algihabitans albus TaxID=2164067 RepID=UPI000E5CC80D|nr:flagellar motor protein MotA [Algihabitans albus]